MLINILTRISRPALYQRCLESITSQTYKNTQIICSSEALMNVDKTQPYYWNLYCNDLKDKVEEGYFVFVDDDDYLAGPTVLQQLAEHLKDEPDGLIVQFLRNGRIIKPTDQMSKDRVLKKGVCGGGCLVLHHKHKNLADWQAKRAADFDWMNEVNQKVNLKFVPLVLQIAPNNGNHGK